MDNYTMPKNTDRKCMVLIVVLFLAIMSMTSAAFAYATVYQIDDNPVTAEYYALDYTDSNGVSIIVPIASDSIDLDIYTETINGNTTMFSDGAGFTREFYVTVKTDLDCKFNLQIECTGDAVLNKIFTINAVTDMEVDGNTATKVTATFTPLTKVDLSTVGLVTDTSDIANIADVKQEIEEHTLTFRMTANPKN